MLSFSQIQNSIFFKLSIVIIVFVLSTLWILYLSLQTTELLRSEAFLSKNETLSFPTNIQELKNLSSLLKVSYTKNSRFILLLFCSAFVYKQSFAIPGSVFLNLLGGSLFGQYYGLLICSSLTTVGALCCFFLSKICGEAVIKRFFEDKLKKARNFTQKQGTYSLLSYLISMRMFPATPNYLLNIFCPILGVPWHLFAISVYVGLMPYIFFCTRFGEILGEVESVNDIFNLDFLFKTTSTSFLFLLPNFLLKRYYKSTILAGEEDQNSSLKLNEKSKKNSDAIHSTPSKNTRSSKKASIEVTASPKSNNPVSPSKRKKATKKN